MRAESNDNTGITLSAFWEEFGYRIGPWGGEIKGRVSTSLLINWTFKQVKLVSYRRVLWTSVTLSGGVGKSRKFPNNFGLGS